MIRTILRHLYRFLTGMGSLCVGIPRVFALAYDPKHTKSYWAQEPLKSNARVLLENLWWCLMHKEVNAFYHLYGFDRKRGPKQSEYMPCREFRFLRNDSNRHYTESLRHIDYRCMLTDKFVFYQYLTALGGFSTPKILAMYDGKEIYWLNTCRSEPFERILEHQPIDAFYKLLSGECGVGVYSLTVAEGVVRLNGKVTDIDGFKRAIPGRSIISQRVVQHPGMAAIYPYSVNTIRLLTVLIDGRPQPFSAFVRFGANGNLVDNSAAGGVLGRLDIETGKLAEDFFFKPGYGGRVRRHPNTGAVFSGFKIPFVREAIEKAVGLHRFFYGIHSIGWDIAITQDGPCFIEGNDNWEITGFQICEGGLRGRFLETL